MTANIRQLTPEEITALSLPLRLKVFRDDLRWLREPSDDPETLRDVYDATSIQLGFFIGERLAGSARLIVREQLSELPCWAYVSDPEKYVGRSAELSKGWVDPEFRGVSVFLQTLEALIERAQVEEVKHLFLTALDTPKWRRFYAHCGFLPCGEPKLYADRLIATQENAIAFYRSLEIP